MLVMDEYGGWSVVLAIENILKALLGAEIVDDFGAKGKTCIRLIHPQRPPS